MDFNLPSNGLDAPLLEGVALALAFGVDPLVEIKVGAALSGFSEAELDAKIREGTYPMPVKIGVRKRALRLSDIKAWNDSPTPSLRRTPKSEPGNGNGTAGSPV